MARHLLRRRRDGACGLLQERLAQPRLLASLYDLAVEPLDDRPRRAGGRRDAPPPRTVRPWVAPPAGRPGRRRKRRAPVRRPPEAEPGAPPQRAHARDK